MLCCTVPFSKQDVCPIAGLCHRNQRPTVQPLKSHVWMALCLHLAPQSAIRTTALSASHLAKARKGVLNIHFAFFMETTSLKLVTALQTVGLYHSFKQSGQPGPITRLVSCTEEQLEVYQDLDIDVPTHFAPSWSVHPRTGDVYRFDSSPYVQTFFQIVHKCKLLVCVTKMTH